MRQNLRQIYSPERAHQGWAFIKVDLIHLTSVSARWRLYRRSVTDLVHTDERTPVCSARSSLVVTHPCTNWSRHSLTSVSHWASLGHHRKPVSCIGILSCVQEGFFLIVYIYTVGVNLMINPDCAVYTLQHNILLSTSWAHFRILAAE